LRMALTRRSCLLKAANQLVPIMIMCATLGILAFTMEQNMPGFIVGDISLNYPKQTETFTTMAAFALMFIYPVLVIFHSLLRARRWGRGYCSKSVLVYWWDKTWCGIFICFVFVLFSEFMKRFVGKLRPNFFAMCEPEYDASQGTTYANVGVFVTNYTCKNELGAESARSFPSGHSLFAILLFSAMGNLLQSHRSNNKVLDPFWAPKLMLQAIITAIIGPAVALTRYTEHYHHSSDVLVGIVLGYIAFLCLLLLERWFIVEPHCLSGYTGTTNNGGRMETNVDEIPESSVKIAKSEGHV